MFIKTVKFLTTAVMVSFLAGPALATHDKSSSTNCDDPSDPCQVRQHMHGDGSFETRKTNGLINLYTFESGVGPVAADAFSADYDLRMNPAAVRWYESSTGMQITANAETEALRGDVGTHRLLYNGLTAWSIEMWIVNDFEPDFTEGPVAYFSVANIYLCGQFDGLFTGRQSFNLQHTWTTETGCRNHIFTDLEVTGFPVKKLHHVVFNIGVETFYEVFIDGQRFFSSTDFGKFVRPEDIPLKVSHPLSVARFGRVTHSDGEPPTPFGGSVYLIAAYDRILTQEDVTAHYNAGLPNQRPVATNDVVRRLLGAALQIPVADLLANDFDFDTANENLTLELSNPASGQATVSLVDGVVTYTPNSDFHGGDSFTYVLTDNTEKTSKPATVTIEIIDAPIANAGDDQTVHQGEVVMLMGSGSTTGNADPILIYDWSFTSKPDGSQAVLDNPVAANPTFIADVAGDYRVALVVTDTDTGNASAPNEVVISTNNTAPVADAGADHQATSLGELVNLDGAGSYDDDGDAITYAWSLSQQPDGSTATLVDNGSATPSITIDAYGDYVITLQVFDALGGASELDTVTVSTLNLAPVADATADKLVVTVGKTVTLDGSASAQWLV